MLADYSCRLTKRWTSRSPSCSTGEEAISLAVILEEYCTVRRCGDYIVYATDINSKALSRLKEGKYPYSSLRQDGKKYHGELLERYAVEKGDYTFEIAPKLLSKIEARRINFFSDPQSSLPQGVHILFFRNTLVYFSENKRKSLIDRLVSRIAPGGDLVLSSGEIPFVAHPQLELREFDQGHVLRKVGTDGGPDGRGVSSVHDTSKTMRSGGA